MSQSIIILHLNCSGCTAEAWLNGIPVTRVNPQALSDSRPVHEYLLPGENRVVLLVQPGQNPSEPMASGAPFTPPPGAFATLQIRQGPRGVFPDDPQVRTLASVEWRPEPNTPPVTTPVMLETTVVVSHSWPRWSWLEASRVSLSSDIVDRVHTLVHLLAEGMSHGDTSRYLRAAETRFAEIGRAYGLSEGVTQANFTKQFQRLSAEPGFRIVEVPREKMALRLCADGKVIECLDTSFEPLLRAAPRDDGSTPVRYPMKLAMFGQQMRIIR